ncbi:hypothetical protein DL93DRAFT_1897993 [Clavulina sp. PMI_390]|nr:hypothetical protein DL93DRAFT_1897993 [Clavulina sp. PMI_390]
MADAKWRPSSAGWMCTVALMPMPIIPPEADSGPPRVVVVGGGMRMMSSPVFSPLDDLAFASAALRLRRTFAHTNPQALQSVRGPG